MPMGETDEFCGTEADGTKSRDYCKYCLRKRCVYRAVYDGPRDDRFLSCKPMLENVPGLTEAAAREMMQAQFPKLKRWQA